METVGTSRNRGENGVSAGLLEPAVRRLLHGDADPGSGDEEQ